MKSISLLLFFAISWTYVCSQNAELRGELKELETDELLAGANIRYAKGKGTVTDASGKYILSIPAGDYEISFSAIGYKTEKRKITLKEGEKQTLDISLKVDVFKLTEVVSVSQYKKNTSKETVSMSVVSKEQIQHTNSNDVAEVVNRVPGVLVQDGQISIRGGSSYSYGVGSRTMLLVDGLNTSSADLGQTQNNLVPLENVKQVEVVKGASSVIYGSSALNGVVNVITGWPTGAEPKTEMETNVGVSDKPEDPRMQWWSTAPPFFGSVNINHQRRIKDLQLITGGNIYYNSSYLQGNSEWRARGFLKMRYLDPKHPGLNYGVNTSLQIERTDQFFISRDLDSLAFVPAANSNSEYNKVTIDPHLYYNSLKGHNYKLNIRYMNIFRQGHGADPNAVSHFFSIDNQYQYRLRKDLLIVTAGIPFSFGHSKSNLYNNDWFNFNWAVYAQAEMNYKILSLQAGVRYEIAGLDTQIITSRPIFRSGLNIQASKSTNIRISWGQGYRIPSIAEKYVAQPFITGVNIIPNDTLKDESGWNFEIGVQQGIQIKNWKAGIDLAFFWQEYKDFIEYNVGVFPNYFSNGQKIFADSLEISPGLVLGPRAQNIQNARIAGYEISLLTNGKIGPVGVNITAGYTYNFPTQKTNDSSYTTRNFFKDVFTYAGKRVSNSDTVHILPYRFRHLVRADIELSYWKVYAGATFYYISTPEKVPLFYKVVGQFIFNDRNAVDEYLAKHGNGDFAMDIRGGMKFNERFAMGFIVKNVTNHFYSLRPGKPEAPRNFTIQFRYNF